MTSVGFLFVSLFIELGFEVVIDVMALQVEGQEGIDMTEFWNMWRGSQSYIQAVCGIFDQHTKLTRLDRPVRVYRLLPLRRGVQSIHLRFRYVHVHTDADLLHGA